MYLQIYDTKNIIEAYCIAIGYIDTQIDLALSWACVYQITKLEEIIERRKRMEMRELQTGWVKVAGKLYRKKRYGINACWSALFIYLFACMHVFCPEFIKMLSK